ncbi:galactitol-1-phosphate 5-dehydrogenase [Neobacillus sp. YIM B06451]|uniref:galactitol-1-phosphate 5-dehydrogenase n=1 Tax=Neobacillus sp. YIM B06451 TaxID=3070994 RepID=UPI002930DC85|nr:galactitol-1-phosphate 5-dehydrogenase [Neobacillus sp. YIM B06451]
MKAGVLHAREDIKYEEIRTPSPKAGEVLIKVKYTGICGSDIPRVNGNASHYYPNVLGHEFSGVVAKLGEGVETLKVGDKVAGVPLVPCMECEDCEKGDYALCKHYSFIGSRQFGSFAEYVVVPEKNAVKFDDSISFEHGAFFEPITVALHGLNRLDYKPGGTVAILGCGTIGLFTMQWAKIFGAKKIVVFDINEERLVLARKYGADEGINTLSEGFIEQAKALTNGRGFDYVYETAGSTKTIKMAFDLVANKGGVCLIGTPTTELSFTVEEWEQLNRKEFNLTGSWMSYSNEFPGKEWELTAQYIRDGEFKLDESLVFKKLPLSKIDEAFNMYKTPGVVKAKILIDSEQ